MSLRRIYEKLAGVVSSSALAVIFVLVGALNDRAEAHQYDFTKIADTTGPLAGIDAWPCVNGSGQVAYVAHFDGSSALALYRADGTATTTIATSNVFASNLFGSDQSINNNGEVAYFDSQMSPTSVFKGSGGAVTTIANSTNFSAIGGWGPSINDNGTVIFGGTLKATGRKGIYASGGSAVTTVVDTSGQFSDFLFSPAVNDSGTVAFCAASKATGLWGIYTIHDGTVTTIADTLGPISNFYSGLGEVTINDAGMVAFVADLDAGGSAVYRGDGTTLEKIVDTSGLFSSFGAHPVINNLGNVGFVGMLKNNGGWGLYDGPDAVNDKIVQTGDVINGQVVGGIEPLGMCYADNGWATFISQSSGPSSPQFLYVAHPVPEPSTSVLLAIGLFGLVGCIWRKRRR